MFEIYSMDAVLLAYVVTLYLLPELTTLNSLFFYRMHTTESCQQKETFLQYGVSIIIPIKIPEDEAYIDIWITQFRKRFSKEFELILICNSSTKEKFVSYDDDWIRLVISKDTKSKAENLNYAICLCKHDIIGIFDADAFPTESIDLQTIQLELASFDCIQGMNLVKLNNTPNYLSKFVALENILSARNSLAFKNRGNGVSQFRGTNGYWKKSFFSRMQFDNNCVLEDIDITIRCLIQDGSISFSEKLVSLEEPPLGFRSWIAQRTRWAIGWGQLCRRHCGTLFESTTLTTRKKALIAGYLVWAAFVLPVAIVFLILSPFSLCMLIIIISIRTCFHIILAKLFPLTDFIPTNDPRRSIDRYGLLFLILFEVYLLFCDLIRGLAFLGFFLKPSNQWSPTKKSNSFKS